MIFGRGGGGGIVNRVTKRSSFNPVSRILGLRRQRGRRPLDRRRRPAARQRRRAAHQRRLRKWRQLPPPCRPRALRDQSGRRREGRRAIRASTWLRIFPRPPDRRPRRPGRDGDEPLKGFDSIFFGDPDESFAKADVHVGTLAVEHRFGDGADAAQSDALRRLRQILSEHLSRADLDEATAEHGRSRRLQQPQRPPEPVQPDRPRSGTTASAASTRRCCSASNSAARSPAIPANRPLFALGDESRPAERSDGRPRM